MNEERRLINRSFLTAMIFLFACAVLSSCKDKSVNDPGTQDNTKVKFWLTAPNQNIYFTEQQSLTATGSSGSSTIEVNPDVTFQEIDGFGFSLTGGSAYHIFNMAAANRNALLTELFDFSDKNIGVSYLRVSIGSSDLDLKVFSYDDLPAGETDPNMEKFTLAEDRKYLIPILKEILAINPDIKIMGSPWSAPVWMKTNRSSIGGSLKPEYYDAYAKYFVKYVQEIQKEGITIDAITVQNEPLHPGNNPSMLMLADEQAKFIKNNLGPAFQNAGIQTKIIIYDHNADRIDYPLAVLNDPGAGPYIDGSAFHLYGGEISALSTVHNAHPDKNLYFTEQWIGAPGNFPGDIKWHIREVIIGATRNWCRVALEWNLAADANQDPHTNGGCTQCLGGVTIEGNTVTRNPAYYIVAHVAKFVRPGSFRIESNQLTDLPNVAFATPDGNRVVIVLNNGGSSQSFLIKIEDRTIKTTLAAGAVGTFVW